MIKITEASGVLDVDYSQFWLGDDVIKAFFGDQIGGLLWEVSDGDGVVVNTVVPYGPARITLRTHLEQPATPSEDWHDVVLAAIELTSSRLTAVGLMGRGDTVQVAVPHPGMYALQVASKLPLDEDSEDPGRRRGVSRRCVAVVHNPDSTLYQGALRWAS